jgi:CheY-like chemotaxis protein
LETGIAGCVAKPVRNQELWTVLSRGLADATVPGPKPAVTQDTAGERLGAFGDRSARILLAEDNVVGQYVALGILKKLGFHADAVSNGAEALRQLECAEYDLVLMDVQMPVIDGIEATRQIRQVRSVVRDRDVPIIAMTAHAMETDRQLCLDAGMNDYLSKPVSLDAVAGMLLRWLPHNNKGREHCEDLDCR